MAELTEREQKIVHAIFIMLNPNLNNVPFNVKDNLIRAAFHVGGLKFDEDEMTDLVQAISRESKRIMQNGLKFISNHPDLFKGLKSL